MAKTNSTIATLEERATLPEGSIVRIERSTPVDQIKHRQEGRVATKLPGNKWEVTGLEGVYADGYLRLPVTVLFTPVAVVEKEAKDV